MTEAKELREVANWLLQSRIVGYERTAVIAAKIIERAIEALSTAPVALGAGWNTDLDAMPHALTLLFKAHDPDEPEGVVSLGIRGEEPQRLIAWSFLPSAIHPAPSREAVIEPFDGLLDVLDEIIAKHNERAPKVWDLINEARELVRFRKPITEEDRLAIFKAIQNALYAHSGSPISMDLEEVSKLLREAYAAIRSLPSNAPSLGEARLAEGEPVFTYTRTFNAIAAAVEWKPNNAFGISVRKFVEAFGPNPSHELATRMAEAYSISERAAP